MRLNIKGYIRESVQRKKNLTSYSLKERRNKNGWKTAGRKDLIKTTKFKFGIYSLIHIYL